MIDNNCLFLSLTYTHTRARGQAINVITRAMSYHKIDHTNGVKKLKNRTTLEPHFMSSCNRPLSRLGGYPSYQIS